MAYNKTNWIDNVTNIDADKMNNIENGIKNNENSNISILEFIKNAGIGDVEPRIVGSNEINDLNTNGIFVFTNPPGWNGFPWWIGINMCSKLGGDDRFGIQILFYLWNTDYVIFRARTGNSWSTWRRINIS